ncbi:ribonuclease M5 [Spiroplasma turonicum]|uniref:Ribonuclease M5 n=1 Tax=Spiroplasma turonicum TaxID=216946 RepID=A0A0K1P7Q6_9MOLU|nr:ribonuclease M5 [Spiroplasma turonicum]AKU80320.1 primase-like protein [Spiroplasma turonicum]ALX71321.1 ribonuclease M5 [Spiroplasma turonicum]
MKIMQVVVVEGFSDTIKLKKIFGKENIDTIETNGLAITNQKLNLLADLNKTRGLIIFTDPDGPGIKIRDIINTYLNFKCFNAFINKKTIKNSKKIGIAEASDEEIKRALNELIIFNKNEESLSWNEFLINNFFEASNRKKIAEHFNWSEKINNKRLFKWLNYLNLSAHDIKKILEE